MGNAHPCGVDGNRTLREYHTKRKLFADRAYCPYRFYREDAVLALGKPATPLRNATSLFWDFAAMRAVDPSGLGRFKFKKKGR
ncbi:MAG TPA: hypothetical protein PLS51_03640 [Flavobacterium sp.]|mgnify:FL=1|nr:hypothetical protein [Flavobacterium sp.]